jgi:hypothetical protein
MTIVGIVIFTSSVLFMSYRMVGVIAAFNEWTRLKNANPYSARAVEDALKILNEEEIALMTPLALALLSSAVALRSVKLKIVPKKCHYCGKWAKPRRLTQTPDKAFHYHEACEAKGRQQRDRHVKSRAALMATVRANPLIARVTSSSLHKLNTLVSIRGVAVWKKARSRARRHEASAV